MGIKLVIIGNPVTKKNSQRILVNRKTGRAFISPSEAYKKYEKYAVASLAVQAKDIGLKAPIEIPVTVKCIFYMQTRRAVDRTNLEEAAHDVLVKAKILSDDCSRIIVSGDGTRVLYDKENPRTEIFISRYREG